MPRYFFSCEGAQSFTDQSGTVLPDDQVARLQAVDNAAQVLKDHAAAFADSARWRVYVTDEAGRSVFVIMLSAGAD